MGMTRGPRTTEQSRSERIERGWGVGRTRLAAAVAVVAFALCALGGAAITATGGGPTSSDGLLYRAISAHRSAWFDVPSLALNQLFQRARPPHHEIAVNLWAYPWGHSAVAASLVVVTALLVRRRRLWIVGALYVISMGFSRMYLNVHWFTDVLGGAAVGLAVGLALWAAVGAVRSLVLRRGGRNPVIQPSMG
jgi:membrane-associated phospholipid phosphatase